MKKYENYKGAVSELSRTEQNFHTFGTLPTFLLDWLEHNCTEIFVILNERGEVLFVSESVNSILGYTKSELIGIMWQEMVNSENIPAILEELTNNEKSEYIFDLNIRNKGNKFIAFKSLTAKVKDSINNTFYYTSILKNHTQYRDVEEMLIQSEKMSIAGQFAAGLAHEIRNPLTSLKGFLQLLRSGGKGKDAYYQIMIDEIDKIEAITSELLFISKPTTDARDRESIRTIIHDVIILLKTQASLKNIHLEFIQEKEIYFHCNQAQMKQVFINLIKNAIEAMNEQGTIKLIVDIKDSKIIIDVIDEGPSIPTDIIHKLTTPFFTTKQKGTGLGLMITKQILDQHDAEIVITKNQEIGNTFRVVLPYDPDLD